MAPSAEVSSRITSQPRDRLKSSRPRPRSMLPFFRSSALCEPTSSSHQPVPHSQEDNLDRRFEPRQYPPRPEEILPKPNTSTMNEESSPKERPQSIFANLSMPGYPFLGSVSPATSSMPSPCVPFSPRPRAFKSGSRANTGSTARRAILTASRRLSVPSFGVSSGSFSMPNRRDSVIAPMTLSYFAMPGNPIIGVVPPPSPPSPSMVNATYARPKATRHGANNGTLNPPSRRPVSWAAPSPCEVSPTLTMPVEGKARARDKNEEIELVTFSPVPEENVGVSSSAMPTMRCSDGVQISTAASRPTRKPTNRSPSNRMSSFWGWDGLHMLV